MNIFLLLLNFFENTYADFCLTVKLHLITIVFLDYNLWVIISLTGWGQIDGPICGHFKEIAGQTIFRFKCQSIFMRH